MTRFVIVFFLLLLCGKTNATSVITPAQGAITVLSESLKFYAESHQGRLPSSWSELDPYLVSSLEQQLGTSLDEGIMLVNDKGVEMASPNPNEIFNGGQIIAITSSSIGEDRREKNGRYIIWKDPKGRFRTAWLNEEVVKTQFSKANVELPAGPFWQQPPVLQASPEYVIKKYAQENFKDPKNPTAEELEKMKQVFAEKYSDKPKTSPLSTAAPAVVMPKSASSGRQSTATPAGPEAKAAASGFPIWPVAIVVAVIVAGAMFLVRRRSR